MKEFHLDTGILQHHRKLVELVEPIMKANILEISTPVFDKIIQELRYVKGPDIDCNPVPLLNGMKVSWVPGRALAFESSYKSLICTWSHYSDIKIASGEWAERLQEFVFLKVDNYSREVECCYSVQSKDGTVFQDPTPVHDLQFTLAFNSDWCWKTFCPGSMIKWTLDSFLGIDSEMNSCEEQRLADAVNYLQHVETIVKEY